MTSDSFIADGGIRVAMEATAMAHGFVGVTTAVEVMNFGLAPSM